MSSPANGSFLLQTPWREFAKHLRKATLSFVLSLSVHRKPLISLDRSFCKMSYYRFLLKSLDHIKVCLKLDENGTLRGDLHSLTSTYGRLHDKYTKCSWQSKHKSRKIDVIRMPGNWGKKMDIVCICCLLLVYNNIMYCHRDDVKRQGLILGVIFDWLRNYPMQLRVFPLRVLQGE